MYLKTTHYKQFDFFEIKESSFNEFSLPDHFHDTYCFSFIEKGWKNFTINQNERIIHANCAHIINPFQIHSDKNIDNEDCIIKMVYVNQEVIAFFAKQIMGSKQSKITFTNDLIVNPLLSAAISQFFSETDKIKLLELKLKELVKILLYYPYQTKEIEVKNCHNNAISESIEKVTSSFSQKIELDKMAKECKMSKFQFIRHFKKETGMTPAAYILYQRITNAKKLILQHVPIGEAALEVGFYDHAQFCKFFKYYTNISPTEFKRNCNIIQA